MQRRHATRLVFHGLVLVLIGMLAGIPFTLAITEGWGEDAARAWRVVHTSLISGGALYLAMGAAAPFVRLSQRASAFLTGLLMGTAYLFATALCVGAAVGARGLEPVGPPLHLAVFAAALLSVAALFVAVGILLAGARAALVASE